MVYHKTKLKNGIRVMTVPMKDNPTVTFMVLVETGSEYEDKKLNGISHFLEHMCFKGTKNRDQKEISYELDSIGATNNAFTGGEFTGYYAKSDYKHADKILDIVSDIYLNPTFPEETIEKEKGVVVEELNMYNDDPRSLVWDNLASLMYGDQGAGWKIIGSEKSVRAIKGADLHEYYNRRYVPEATVVVAAGNFDNLKILKEIKKRFQNIKNKRKIRKIKTKINQRKPRIKIEHKKGEQSHLVLAFNAYSKYDKKRYALSVLDAILGGGMSSRLFQKMRDELGVCYYIGSFTNKHTDRGEFGIYAGVNNSRVEEALSAIMEELKLIMKLGVPERELQKAKEFITGHTYMGLESSNSYADYYGFQALYYKDIVAPKDKINKIKSVTSKDIKRVAEELFKNSNINLSIVGPVKNKTKLLKIIHF